MNYQNKGYWIGMTSLNQVVCKAIAFGSNDSTSPEALESCNDLEIALNKHRSTFISLLRNPRKSQTERKTLQRAVQEPVTLPGFTLPKKLPESFLQEVLILSDMFDLSELSAFTLLKSAEEERTLYPSIPRGLIAILFYYDSREQLANTFKLLVQARQGISWTLLPANEELSISITRYLAQFLNISILDRILEIISSTDLTKEIELLQKNRALGDAKHRSMVIEKFQSVHTLLAESVFCWSAQTPMKKEECKRLLAYLSKVKLSETKNGSIDHINLSLLVALLYSIDASYLINAEDITEALSQFPITNDAKFIPEIHKEIKEGNWESKGLLAIVQLAWAVSLSSLRQLVSTVQLADKEVYLDEDEIVLNEALESKVFKFIESNVLTEENKPLENFYLQKFHNIMADFIFNMFDRVKMMKTKADENARHIMNNIREGLQPPPILEQPYEDLLSCLAALYSGSRSEEIVDEYWYDTYSISPVHGHNSRQMALYRFMRLPGDFLPPSLFVPFINFVTSVAGTPKSAQSVYNFLRLNSQPASQGCNLSWDNFLNAFSQYFNNLRAQHPQSMHETVYRNNPKHCISPAELEGLISVLKLIEAVAIQDESARIAICDNTSWSPTYVFVGLITCNIPLKLKAWLFRVLSAFSRSSSLAGRIWQSIESAAFIPSQNGAPGYSNRGITQDIEEIESVSEEFPLTQAFLDLMFTFVSVGAANQHGSISQPGFRPYLDLLKNQIFLPHDTRTYKNSAERWAISKKCLALFSQLLIDYKPPPQNHPSNESWRHPSHLLLIDLVHDSRLLRQILCVLHDGVKLLDQFTKIPGQKDMEDTTLYILKLILEVYRLQRHVLAKDAEGEVLITGIDRLLQSMNPRSGCCDHLKNVAQILAHYVTIPLHAAHACRILTIIASTQCGQNHLMPLLAAAPYSAVFRQNFVQLLDHSSLDEAHTKAATEALTFLKSCFTSPAPNLSHFLLGFVDGVSASSSELRADLLEPGVRGFPRTAFHSLLAALPTLTPVLSENAFSLLTMLASHHLTSAATLRYLSSHDFVYQSLSNLPLCGHDNASRLMCMGWILRIAALDLRYHSSHKQRSHLRRLINILIAGSDIDAENSLDTFDASLGWAAANINHGGRGILLSLLEMADLNVESPQPLQSQYQSRVQQLMTSCEEVVNGVKILNISQLHQLLHQLMQSNRAGGAISQNEHMDSEIQEILDYSLNLNHAREMLFAQRHFLESWRQLVEVTLAILPSEITEVPVHQAFLHTLTLELTRRLLDESSLPELSSTLVSTLLLLITTLHSLHSNIAVHGQSSRSNTAYQLPSSLQLILRGTIDCLLKFKQSNQSVRASLYAALLSYLRIATYSGDNIVAEHIDAQRETSVEQFHRENFECIRDDLPQLVDILSCEASAGHMICRLLSLSCLDSLSALERRSAPVAASFLCESLLLNHLSDQGHLRRIINAIGSDDRNLIDILNDGRPDLRPLYLWEARSALLSRLSLTPNGARLLLQNGMMTKIAEMQVFKYQPAEAAANIFMQNGTTQENTASQIYDSAVTGAVRVCMAVLTSLGTKDDSAVSQVMLFLSSNVDSISESMRVPKGSITGSLNQLALLTNVIAAASPPALFSDSTDPSALQTAAQSRRLCKQLLFLLPYVLPHGRLGQSVEDLPEIDEDEACIREVTRTSLLTVFTNCLVHARDYLMQDNPSGSGLMLIFKPTIDNNDRSKNRNLSLGVLIDAIDQAAQQFTKARRKKEEVFKYLQDMETAHYDSIKKYVSSSLVFLASPATVRKLAAIHLSEVLSQHNKQIELCVHAVESAILLLYRHIEFYLGKPSAVHTSALATTEHLTAAQVEDLRSKIRCLVEQILPSVVEVATSYSNKTSHVPFLESCITRIKWILSA